MRAVVRRPLRPLLGVLAVLALLLLPPGAPASTQPAATPDAALHHAGLVVRHGDGRVTYAYVAFPEAELSGADLLARSGIEQVTIPFGALGIGVCALEGEGCGATECRRRVCQGFGAQDPYWQYFRQVSPGDWRPLPLGASAAKVGDGQVDAWGWTADATLDLPALTLPDLARLAGADPEAPASALRTDYPPGWTAPADGGRQRPAAYALAGAVLALMAAGAVIGVRRARRAA